jgi:molecular chaperone DnaK
MHPAEEKSRPEWVCPLRQVPAAVIDAINAEIANVRGAIEGGNAADIKAKNSALQSAMMKIGESLAGKGGASSGGAASSEETSSTYDADVKDDKK